MNKLNAGGFEIKIICIFEGFLKIDELRDSNLKCGKETEMLQQ